MSESALTKTILDHLNGMANAKAIKLHGSQYQEVGTPDIMACIDGRAYMLEVKTGHNKPSSIQLRRLKEWGQAGAKVTIARSMDDVYGLVADDTNEGIKP